MMRRKGIILGIYFFHFFLLMSIGIGVVALDAEDEVVSESNHQKNNSSQDITANINNTLPLLPDGVNSTGNGTFPHSLPPPPQNTSTINNNSIPTANTTKGPLKGESDPGLGLQESSILNLNDTDALNPNKTLRGWNIVNWWNGCSDCDGNDQSYTNYNNQQPSNTYYGGSDDGASSWVDIKSDKHGAAGKGKTNVLLGKDDSKADGIDVKSNLNLPEKAEKHHR